MKGPAGASPRPAAISDDERLARLRLAFSDNVGPSTWHHLIGQFGSAQAAIEGLPELASRAGAGRRVRLYPVDKALRDIEQTAQCGGTLLSYGEEGYPMLLDEAGHAPPALFARGRVEMLNQPCCAIVGSRNASANGRRFARELAMVLGRSGWVVASGLARGIDTAAHQAALETGTIAVMATGLDVVYPAENEGLAEQIAGTGCLVTEMPPGTQPEPNCFPAATASLPGCLRGLR